MNPLVAQGIVKGLTLLGGWLYNRYFGPKPPPPPTPEKLSLPQVDEGTAVPIIYGRVRVNGPLLVWTGPLHTKVSDNGNNGAQYIVYAVDMLFVIGMPMGFTTNDLNTTRANRLDPATPKLYNVWIGDNKLPSPGVLPKIFSLRKMVFRPDMFGGPGAGGGMFGAYEFFGGWTDQSLVYPFPSPIGDAYAGQHGGTDRVPGFRKQMLIGFTDYPRDSSDPYWATTELDGPGGTSSPISRPQEGFTLGENAQLGGISVEVSSYGDRVFSMNQPGYDFGGDADPAEVIYDMLTNRWGRLGLSPSKIDLASFSAASVTLKAEDHGYSMAIMESADATDAIVAVLAQIDAVLYEEPSTGLITLKLIRDDYDELTIPHFTSDDIVSVNSYTLGSWRETTNEVRVNYLSRQREYKPAVAVAQTMANAVINNYRRMPRSIDYHGCTNAVLAAKLAARDLNVYSQPPSTISLTLNRTAHRLRPGAVFRVTWPEYNIDSVIFRAGVCDVGQLFDNKVVVEAVKDPFATPYIGYESPVPGNAALRPSPMRDRVLVEAPRWIAVQGHNIGIVTDPDVPHVYALPGISGNDEQFTLKTRGVEGNTNNPHFYEYMVDVPQMYFPITFQIEDNYPRWKSPKDTTNQLYIINTVWPGHTSAQIDQVFASNQDGDHIRSFGTNLIALIDDETGDMEFMAFEYADGGGGGYMLCNVWRGLLDTPPRDWPERTRGVFITTEMLGRRGWNGATTIRSWYIPRTGQITGSGEDPEDTHTLAARALRPYPPANLTIGGDAVKGVTAMPAAAGRYVQATFLEESFDIYGYTRDRRSPVIMLGTDPSEIGNDFSPTTYHVTVRDKNGVNWASTSNGGSALSPSTVGGDSLGGGYFPGAFGNVTIEVSSQRIIAVGDPMIGTGGVAYGQFYTSWRPALVDAFVPSWANTLGDVRFSYEFSSDPTLLVMWGMNSVGGFPWPGTVVRESGTLSLQRASSGWGSYYARNTSGAFAQRGQLTRFKPRKPRNLQAVFVGYVRANADTNDNISLELSAYGIPNPFPVTVASGSSTPLPAPTTHWQRRTLTVTLPATANGSVQVRYTMEEVAGGGTGSADLMFTESELRFGKFLQNIAANYSFDTNLVSWTVLAGSFVVDTAIASPSVGYAQGGPAATSIMGQDYYLIDGWEVGSSVFATFFRAQTIAGDSGSFVLQAHGPSGLLATTDTTLENLPALNQWFKRTVFLSIPPSTTHVRMLFTATRTGGAGNSGACLDEVSVWMSKELLPVYERELVFDAPSVQPMPASWQQHQLVDALETVTTPTWMFGGGNAEIGTTAAQMNADFNGEEVQWTDQVDHYPGKLVGQFGGGVTSVNAYRFVRGVGASAVHVAATGGARRIIGATTSAQALTVIVFYRVDEVGFSTACGLVGRMDLTAGWGLSLDASGYPVARLRGNAGEKTATIARSGADGALHMAAMIYDPIAKTLTVLDERGASVATSTATGLGEIAREAVTAHLRIGRDADERAVIPGDIARVYIWKSALTTTQVLAHWNYAVDPNKRITTYTRTAAAIVPVGSDVAGERYAVLGAAQIAMPVSAALAADGGTGYGIAVGRTVTNRVQSFNFADTLYWLADAGSVLTQKVEDPSGRLRGVRVAGDATNGIRALGVTVGAAPSGLTLTFWARCVVPITPTSLTVQLMNASNTVLSSTPVTLQPTWKRFNVLLAGWDGSSATCRLRFVSTLGALTFELGEIVHCTTVDGTQSVFPAILPAVAGGTHGAYNFAVAEVLPLQLNREGEIYVQGVQMADSLDRAGSLAGVRNATDNKNRREVQTKSGVLGFRGAHYDGAGLTVNSDVAYSTMSSQVWAARNRWNYLGLDDATVGRFAHVGFTDTDQPVLSEGSAGRTAAWTHDTTQCTLIEVGTGIAGAPEDTIIRRVVVRAREELL